MTYLIKLTYFPAGDVMGPTLSNLQQLLRLPYGCGEQNIIHFAPSVFVMKYFKKTGQITEDIRNKAMEYLLLGTSILILEM